MLGKGQYISSCSRVDKLCSNPRHAMKVHYRLLIRYLPTTNSMIYRLNFYLSIIPKFYWSFFIMDKFKMEIAGTIILIHGDLPSS